jgi:hypothetical protein
VALSGGRLRSSLRVVCMLIKWRESRLLVKPFEGVHKGAEQPELGTRARPLEGRPPGPGPAPLVA